MRTTVVARLLLVLLFAGVESNLVRLGPAPRVSDWGSAQDAPQETMALEIPVEGASVALELRKTDVVPSDVPVLLGTGRGTFVLRQNDEASSSPDFVLWIDPEKQASFVTWKRHTHGQLEDGMMGVFHFHGNAYTVEPMDGRMESMRPSLFPSNGDYEPVMITLNGIRLSMKKVNRKDQPVSGTGSPLTRNATRRQEELRKFLREHAEENSFGNLAYEVEILVVLDESVFATWVKKSRSFDYKTREEDAIDHIKYYFAEVLNGIALRYGLMSEHRIRLRPVGFYIAKSDEASYWTEMTPIKQNYHFTDAGRALDEFKGWLHRYEQLLPAFDYAMLFTQNALVVEASSDGASDERRIVSGLSDVMGVCQYSKASICHDGGLAASVEAGSWELGNGLGAYDDAACQDKATKSAGAVREVNSDYPLQLSDCSKKALWGYLYYLKLNRTNCLLRRDDHPVAWDRARYVQRYAGERYTADEQCKVAHGIHSFSCRDGKKDKSICSEMHCWMPYRGRCESSPTVAAADGTPCGDDFWCMRGQCVRHAAAPDVNDTRCADGDYRGIVDDANGYDCYELGLNEPYKCYDRYFKAYCCDTCARVLRTEARARGCEYGDKDPKVCGDSLKPSDCYRPEVAGTCCESCARYRINVSGCEYGDKSSACQRAVVQKSMCYDRNDTCCLTCPRLQVGLKGCEWGDRIPRCRGNPISKCYEPAFAHDCCDYCNRLKIGPLHCEWGDKIGSCTHDDCLSPEKRNACCKTCSAFSGTSTGPPRSVSSTTSLVSRVSNKTSPTTVGQSSTTTTTSLSSSILSKKTSTASLDEKSSTTLTTTSAATTSTTSTTTTSRSSTTTTTTSIPGRFVSSLHNGSSLPNLLITATPLPASPSNRRSTHSSNVASSIPTSQTTTTKPTTTEPTTTKATTTKPTTTKPTTTKPTTTKPTTTEPTTTKATTTKPTTIKPTTTKPTTTKPTTIKPTTTKPTTTKPTTIKPTTIKPTTTEPTTTKPTTTKPTTTKPTTTKPTTTKRSSTTEKTTTTPLNSDESLSGDLLDADIIYVSDETCQDSGQYCYLIRSARDCYARHLECCATCRQYETNNPVCPYGDKISWCRRYVFEQGPQVCDRDPFVRSECCGSCDQDTAERLVEDAECEDKAGWCASIFPGQCYDTVTRKTCCAKCSSLRRHDVRCLYGDVYSWCSKTYCRSQARQCCKTCGRRV